MGRLCSRAWWAAFACLLALSVLCITGTFLGAARACSLFMSAPLVVCWLLLAAALLIGALRWRRSPGMATLHLGAALVMVGVCADSEVGHRVLDGLSGQATIHKGRMLIPEGAADDRVVDLTGADISHLPFQIRLDRFTIERYAPHGAADTDAPVRSYRSDVTILEEGRSVRQQAIEVNRPLHYGGYHFYQFNFGGGQRPFAVLHVSSDRGMGVAYPGFALVGAGAAWWAWVGPVWEALRRRREHDH